MLVPWAQVGALACAGLLVGTGYAARSAMQPQQETVQELVLPPPLVLSLFALGHRAAVADLVWVKTLNYYGGSTAEDYSAAYTTDLLDAVAELDPSFRYAYLFAGLALSNTPEGLAASDRFFAMGRERFADDWHFPFYLGINQLIYHDDNRRAGEWMAAAASIEGVPAFIAGLAARLQVSSGDCDQSLATIDTLLRNSRDAMLTRSLEERQRLVLWECQFKTLEAAQVAFAARQGRPARDLAELRASGGEKTATLPEADPFGGRFTVDAKGQVVSSTKRARLRVSLPAWLKESLQP